MRGGRLGWEEDSAGTQLPAWLWGLQLRLPIAVDPGGGAALCSTSLAAEGQEPPAAHAEGGQHLQHSSGGPADLEKRLLDHVDLALCCWAGTWRVGQRVPCL